VSTIEETTNRLDSFSVKKNVSDTDETIPYRLVGTYEYKNALDSFTRLLQISAPEEIEVFDRVLDERPEFTYFQGVNSAFQTKPNLKQANPFQRERFYDEFQKKGLAWMMALARIELSATESLYGKSEFPFESTTPNAIELEAYLSVLADDVMAHMKSLASEAGFAKTIKRAGKIDTWTLAYLRRLKLIRDMLTTIDRVGGTDVKRTIKPLKKEISKHESKLLEKVAIQTQARTNSRLTTSKERYQQGRMLRVSKSAIENCEALVNESAKSNPSSSESPR
jgi:hypothetical protein